MKTVHDLEKELLVFIESLPTVSPEDLKVGDKFVIAGEGYTRNFGYTNQAHWCVSSKSKTMLKYVVYGKEQASPHTLTFKGAVRDRCVLRSASVDDVKQVEKIKNQIALAMESELRKQSRTKDCYVVWNYVDEQIGEKDRYGFEAVRSGFILEAFNGNGELLHRVRMLSEDEVDVLTGEDTERIVRAYAGGFFNRVYVREGAKFQICFAPQID